MCSKRYLVIAALLVVSIQTFGQNDSLPDRVSKFLETVEFKVNKVVNRLNRQTIRALRKFEVKDKQVPEASEADYDLYFDSLVTMLKFLRRSDIANSLQRSIARAEGLKKYLNEQIKFLNGKGSTTINALKKFEKTAYYYNENLKKYKSILKSRKKLEKETMALLYSNPVFKRFVATNSLFASIFKLPGDPSATLATLPGIQTRVSVEQALQARMESAGPNIESNLQRQVKEAQSELCKLKDKINKYGSADADPLHFKPNGQETKTFFQRLEYGISIQFGRASNFLPATSDLGLSLGYKLSDRTSFGIGASYKIGIADDHKKIRFSNTGVGLRSYIDIKFFSRFYLAGGYEQNYYNSFKTFQQLKNLSSWQSSGLVGISKKIRWRQKNAQLRLLYDFLCNNHIPATQPFQFRTGFSLK